MTLSVPYRADACFDGTRGWTTWAHGTIACWVSRRGTMKAHLRWTDDRYGIYGILDGTAQDVVSLYDWWDVHQLPAYPVDSDLIGAVGSARAAPARLAQRPRVRPHVPRRGDVRRLPCGVSLA